jgi:DnaK suppressor protein
MGVRDMASNKNAPKVLIDTPSYVSPKPLPGVVEFQPYNITVGETYMSEKQKAHFIHILKRWRAQIMSDVDSTMEHMQAEAISCSDPSDRASLEEGFSLELRTRDRERKLLKKIEQTLSDIENDLYGYCEDCGAEIGIRRLEARPTATKCIDCKTVQEIKEKQTGKVA